MFETEIKGAADWIIKSQSKDGSFRYEYDPVTDTFSSENKMARQSGTAFMLSEYYQSFQSDLVIQTIDKCLGYLEKISIYENRNDQEIVYAIDGKVGKVNMAAFVIMTLLNLHNLPIFEKYQRFYQANLSALFQQERPQGGFRKLIFPANRKKRSSYADGEALLALTYIYKSNPTAEILEKINLHLAFFDREYRKLIAIPNKTPEQSKYIGGYYLWAMRALDKLPAEQLSQQMLDFAECITEFILNKYDFENDKIRNLGAILEGVAATVSVLRKLNRPNSIIEKVLKNGIENMKNLQFTGQNIQNLQKFQVFPEQIASKLQGGFLNSLAPHNFKMRIDYTQHSLGALMITGKL